jgi:enoyl-CoA hydratase/carnithine racemase
MSLRINKYTAAYWKVTIDNPPLNLFDQEMADELSALIDQLERDEEVKVVVFDSADPEYFISHLDVVRAADMNLAPGITGLSQWPDFAYRLERAPVISVGLIRGRARGVGSEFIQALDVKFASREKTLLCQIEVATGLIPGGGGLERLPLMTGRSRALEIITGSMDYDADTAEKYGWINRSIPDAELDEFVHRFALRIAGFNKIAVATAKAIINERTGIANADDLASTQRKFFELLGSSSTQMRLGELLNRGLQQRSSFEEKLGEHLAQ